MSLAAALPARAAEPAATEPPVTRATDGVAPPAAVAASATAASDAAMAVAERTPIPQLTVEAPEPLKSLLESYLDLARTAGLADAASINGTEWARLVDAAPAQAIELAKTEGYFAATAEISRTAGDPGQPAQVRLRLMPGPQARVGRLTLDVQGQLAEFADQLAPIPPTGGAPADPPALANPATPTAPPAIAQAAATLRASVTAQWPLQPGEPFSGSAWSGAKNAVLAELRAGGYASASWTGTAAEVDAQQNTVRIFVVVDSGPLYRAGAVEVAGTVHHDPERIRSLAGFSTGDALTEQRLQDYQERLGKAGLFDQVTVSIDPDPDNAGNAKVLVRVTETPLQSATTSIGISATTGPRVALEHIHRRAFGQALTSRAKIEWGRDRQAVDTELSTHPDADLGRNIYGASAERLLTSTDMVMSERLRVGRALDRPAVERLNFVEAVRAQECSRDGATFSNCAVLSALSLNTHSIWRRVDDVLLPTLGYTLSTQLGGGLADGSETKRGPFGRGYARLTGYLPLGGWYSQGRIEFGKVLVPAGVQVPDTLRFRAGGDNSVRGYAWRTLSPLKADGSNTGGRMLFTSSVELAHPIVASLPSVWGAAFVDAGRAADELSELKPALGYGIGVRWRSPVGPLSLDWAWGQEVHRGRLHLNIGIVF